ncbi:hypothetical protein BJ508DRAFT_306349 [Ascobolus immersus RN42]|uniref:Uncharacterized protein n=1 Tax=Ascobolus immersus RN42 TaxID=1160509 RepID=A0A3N4IJD3_ASCIM|nr:hypothetical protein BJ508DRAFT_306349 [Ascobolus immersus RN42]
MAEPMELCDSPTIKFPKFPVPSMCLVPGYLYACRDEEQGHKRIRLNIPIDPDSPNLHQYDPESPFSTANSEQSSPNPLSSTASSPISREHSGSPDLYSSFSQNSPGTIPSFRITRKHLQNGETTHRTAGQTSPVNPLSSTGAWRRDGNRCSITSDFGIRDAALVCFGTVFSVVLVPTDKWHEDEPSTSKHLLRPWSRQTSNDPYVHLRPVAAEGEETFATNSGTFMFDPHSTVLEEPILCSLDYSLSEALLFLKTKAESKGLQFEYDPVVLKPFKMMQKREHNTKARSSKPKADPFFRLEVCVNLYGDEALSGRIGDHLSQHDLYLQHPVYPRDGFQYRNPHLFSSDDDDLIFTQHTLTGGIPQKEEKSNEGGTLIETAEIQPSMFDKMFDTTELPLAYENDRIIKVDLKRHQREALYFMKRLELHSELLHTTGGILADDMGMGKTLSMIALLAEPLPEQAGNLPVQATSKLRTLVITPVSVLGNWSDQIERYTEKNSLRLSIYHGDRRELTRWESDHHEMSATLDIVCTTYSTVVSDYKSHQQSQRRSPLHEVVWDRIVLDEAHEIRNSSTKRFGAISELKGRFRWCLTGTPIQNRVEDIGALFQFLRYQPLHSKQVFEREIVKPLKLREHSGYEKLQGALQNLCLRRLKSAITDLLPPKKQQTLCLPFTPEQRQLYDTVKRKFTGGSVGSSEKPASKSNALTSILKLRQICDHGEDLLSDANGTSSSSDATQLLICRHCATIIASCAEEIAAMAVRRCQVHAVCVDCFDNLDNGLDNTGKKEAECSACIEMQLGTERKQSLSVYKGPSVKVKALVSAINKDKSIVFSCWTRMLDLIEVAFRNSGICFVRIDGGMSRNMRDEAIRRFNQDFESVVILVSLMAGGTGINLTRASRVHIMEPHWNPMIEQQAAERCYRIGQEEEVIVTKYVMEHSFEMNILELQQRKIEVATNSLDAKKDPKLPILSDCTTMSTDYF